jgi:hypothetical protein
MPIEGRHDTLSRINKIRPTSWHTICLSSIVLLSSHLRLGFQNGHFPSGFPAKMRTHFSFPCVTYPAHTTFVGFYLYKYLLNTKIMTLIIIYFYLS